MITVKMHFYSYHSSWCLLAALNSIIARIIISSLLDLLCICCEIEVIHLRFKR